MPCFLAAHDEHTSACRPARPGLLCLHIASVSRATTPLPRHRSALPPTAQTGPNSSSIALLPVAVIVPLSLPLLALILARPTCLPADGSAPASGMSASIRTRPLSLQYDMLARSSLRFPRGTRPCRLQVHPHAFAFRRRLGLHPPLLASCAPSQRRLMRHSLHSLGDVSELGRAHKLLAPRIRGHAAGLLSARLVTQRPTIHPSGPLAAPGFRLSSSLARPPPSTTRNWSERRSTLFLPRLPSANHLGCTSLGPRRTRGHPRTSFFLRPWRRCVMEPGPPGVAHASLLSGASQRLPDSRATSPSAHNRAAHLTGFVSALFCSTRFVFLAPSLRYPTGVPHVLPNGSTRRTMARASFIVPPFRV